jgi:hypothetical protein
MILDILSNRRLLFLLLIFSKISFFCCHFGRWKYWNKIATSLTNNNEIQQIAMAPPNFELEHFIDLKIGNATTNINFWNAIIVTSFQYQYQHN